MSVRHSSPESDPYPYERTRPGDAISRAVASLNGTSVDGGLSHLFSCDPIASYILQATQSQMIASFETILASDFLIVILTS